MMGLLQRNPNCGERGWCLLLIKPQNSVFLITCYWSLPLSTFLWPWRLNGWNYCKRGHSTDSIRDNDALPRTQDIHDNHHSVIICLADRITGPSILARSIVDVVMIQAESNQPSTAPFPGRIDRASLQRSSTDHKSVPPCLPASLPGADLKKSVFRFWSPATNIAANVM